MAIVFTGNANEISLKNMINDAIREKSGVRPYI